MKQPLLNRIGWAALVLAFPMSALADLTQTTPLSSNTSLNLDTGGTGSGGDILWNGSTITPQGNAKAFSLGAGGASTFNALTQSSIQVLSAGATNAVLTSSQLAPGSIFVVFTNGGHPAKVLVTASSAGTITLQFVTYGVTGGGSVGAPTVSNVLNNSSDIPFGFPNSGIAPSSLFKVLGTGLSDAGDATLHDSDPRGKGPLLTTLNGASISVTVGGVTKQAALYYATPTQLDGVLPSSTPTGSGTLTVSYKGTASNTFAIQVVQAAPGITTYNGSGVAQHAQVIPNTLVTYTDSAKPGEIIILWGTGLGAVVDSDTAYTDTPHQTNVPYTVFIGGVQASVAYAGASVYPGVGVIGVTIPANVPTGCYVPVAAVAGVGGGGGVVSNIVTLPIAANGGTCADPQLGYNGSQISSLDGSGSAKSGFLVVSQTTAVGQGVTNAAVGIFQKTTSVAPATGGTVSIGGCVVSQTITGGTGSLPVGLNAGTITVTGPGGTPVTLTTIPQLAGFYTATLASIPSTGGAYVFNGTAGSDVGAFTATVSFPNPVLAWTNQSAAANVTRSQGLPVTWSGGTPGSYVIISGSSVNGTATATGSYTCIAPQAAGSFTVPSYVLISLPAGTGSTTVANSTNITQFSATGLDFGGALGSVSFSANSSYN